MNGLSNSANQSRINYLYRDGGNYKFRSYFIVDGKIEIDDIKPFLIDAKYFVPSLVGIDSLVPKMSNSDDHEWHEIDEIEECSEKAALWSAQLLIQAFQEAHSREWSEHIPVSLRVCLESHGWAFLRSRTPPKATWIMAVETSMRRS